MDEKILSRLMWIAITGLLFAGMIFIGLCLFSTESDSILLFAALFCNILAVLFLAIREFNKKWH